MTFIHEDRDFEALLRITADTRGLTTAVVEKDYWVTHTLWSLQRQGWNFWFKGGTCLSKGFRLLQRFSEDLDLKIEPGSVQGLPSVSNWKSEGAGSVEQRRKYFETMARLIRVEGARTVLADDQNETWRSANIEIRYPGLHLDALGGLRPYVLLEVGEARVTGSHPTFPVTLTLLSTRSS